MKYGKLLMVAASLVVAALCGFAVRDAQGGKKVDTRVFEIRTYHANPGKMKALHARFRDHTHKLFVKHGMTVIGYWTPLEAKESQEKLIYLLAFPSREAAAKSWQDFRSDPAWVAARDASERNGPLVAKVDSIYLNATDYSPMK
jgi:NIPSNAP